MQEHIERHPHLNESFEKVAVSFVNRWQVLVPEVFYKEEREEELLEFNAFLKAHTPLGENDLPTYGAKLIFGYTERLEQWMKKCICCFTPDSLIWSYSKGNNFLALQQFHLSYSRN